MSNIQPNIPLFSFQRAQTQIPETENSPGVVPASFQRRTVENARNFRASLTNVIREIEPLVETARSVQQNAISFSSFLNRPHVENQPVAPPQENSYIAINLDTPQVNNSENINRETLHNHAALFLNNDNNQDNNNLEGGDNSRDGIPTALEAQQAIQVLLRYVPFIFILLAKAVYDYHESIFILIVMFTTFAHTNNAVKHEATKRGRRSVGQLAIELVYITVCMVFILYVFEDELYNFNLLMNLVLIRTFTHPLTVCNLLWIVTVTDFTLKLLTVSIKILLTMLPGKIVEFKKRGKIYLFIEAISQLYRSIATIQPWLYYLLESYQGPRKIVSVFLSAFYMISKGSDLMFKVRLLKGAFLKLLQSVAIGSLPSKEQIRTAGDHCPICHDSYDSPVLLQCRHIFCEGCVSTWFDRERTCPLCRARIVDDPAWRDGATSHFVQLF